MEPRSPEHDVEEHVANAANDPVALAAETETKVSLSWLSMQCSQNVLLPLFELSRIVRF